MTVLALLKKSARRLLDRFQPERVHVPDWSDASMCRVLVSLGEPELTRQVQLASDTASLRRVVCRHFRGRSQPAFFADLPRLRELARMAAGVGSDPVATSTVGVYKQCDMRRAAASGWADLASGPGSDDLYPARPHRFAAAPGMALQMLRGSASVDELAPAIRGWMHYAAAATGPMAYLSNLVVIQRVLALSWTWAFLAARPEEQIDDDFQLEFDVLRILFADCRFLLPELGNSYPNNHLLADTFAGWYLRFVFPEFCAGHPSDGLEADAFRRELERQVLEDGTGFEHSTHYHEFACEMTIAFVLLNRRAGLASRHAWAAERLQRMLEFQIDLAGPECQPAAFGNGTEDPLFPLDSEYGWACGAFREIYRALYDASLTPAAETDPSVARARWLLGGELAPAEIGRNAARGDGFAGYPAGGFFVLGDNGSRSRLVFRTGMAPGSRVMAGHMHADLLSVTLSVGGRPTIVDTGTYSYRLRARDPLHGVDGWRSYLCGPGAHNGPTLVGSDPLGGLSDDFRPRDAAMAAITTSLIVTPGLRHVEAALEGPGPYNGLQRGVVHVSGLCWIVYDIMTAASSSTCASRFQLAPSTPVTAPTATQGTAESALSAGPAHLAWSSAWRAPRILNGSIEPRGGWISPEYGTLVAAPQLEFLIDAEANAPGVAAIVLQDAISAAPVSGIEVQSWPGRGLAFKMRSKNFADYVLLAADSTAGELEAWGIRFQGKLLWLRLSNEGLPIEMRWAAARCAQHHASGLHIEAAGLIDSFQYPVSQDLAGGSSPDEPVAGMHITWPTGQPFPQNTTTAYRKPESQVDH